MKRVALIPNLITVCNAVCGFAAIALACHASRLAPAPSEPNPLKAAAWLILLGMVFDVFDGKIARLTGSSSDLGAQLDSLADLVTFGAAPAALVLKLSALPEGGNRWRWLVWCLTTAYFLGALLRLARFNVESDRDEASHECFKGLPTPGAAGLVASLVIAYFYIVEFRQPELRLLAPVVGRAALLQAAGLVPRALPAIGMLLGYAMVSGRLTYAHVGTRLFGRPHAVDQFVYLIFGGVLVAAVPEVALTVIFVSYLLSAPFAAIRQWLIDRKAAEAAG